MSSKGQIGTPWPNDPLRHEIRFLGFELGRVIRRRGGEPLFELVEKVRELSRRRRRGDAAAGRQLHELVRGLGPTETAGLAHAFACFCNLANIAEDRQRVRVLRERERAAYPGPRPESVAAAVEKLRQQGLSADAMRELLARLDVELVFTAHPTEAKRRTVRRTLRRLREDLSRMDDPAILPRERDEVIRRIRCDITCLWHTDPLRPSRPSVLDEVERSLFLFDSLWDIVPRLHREFREVVQRCYPDQDMSVGRFLRFGTWIGGDRDGNPFVTPAITLQTLERLRQRTLEKHMAFCDRLSRVLSLSARDDKALGELEAAIAERSEAWPEVRGVLEGLHPGERYRQWLKVIRFRLDATTRTMPWDDDEPAPGAYASACELAEDLGMIRTSLLKAGHEDLADGELQDWLDRLTVFGFQFARLDCREHAGVLRAAVAELAGALGSDLDWESVSEDERIAFLTDTPDPESVAGLASATLSEETGKTLGLFRVLDRVARTQDGRVALGAFVISMTHRPSDVLCVVWLSRVAAALQGHRESVRLPVTPLFETIDDLDRAEGILDGLLSNAAYREHVDRSGGLQICMVGYSDSTKDGGYLAANWALYEGQRRMAEVTRRHGVDLVIFHGRGGALGRGGGPAARGILGLLPDAVNGKLRMTEQGEVLAERYDDPQIAYRHLEQVTAATLLVSALPSKPPEPAWRELMDTAAVTGFAAYRELIQHDELLRYFERASPINGIESLPIASRPPRRSGRRELGDLRAIPFTFAWTQNRHLINAYFGLGSGLAPLLAEHGTTLQRMYREWRWFRGMIDNATLALAKADMTVASEYAELADPRGPDCPVFKLIEGEFESSTAVALAITGESELLAGTPWLRASIRTRNPYVDPLNVIQIELLKRTRAAEADDAGETDEEVARIRADLLRRSIEGIAAGLRTTG